MVQLQRATLLNCISGGYKSVVLTYRLSDGEMVLEEVIGAINTYELK